MSKQTSSEGPDSAQVARQTMPKSVATAHSKSEDQLAPFVPEVTTNSSHTALTPSTAVKTTNPRTSGKLLIMFSINLCFWKFESVGRKNAEAWDLLSVPTDANLSAGIGVNLKFCISNGSVRWRGKNVTSS